ncbi:MAG: putative Histidine kinase [Gemmatimonadetes bacterium]|nr:putative Histidine kinase [Gemmatimonadota bacterium]
MSPSRILLLATLLPIAALRPGAGGAQARTPPLLPISALRADADGDRVPDRLGDTVRIAGRVTVATGSLARDWLEVFVQDATGGIDVYDRAIPFVMEGGDSVEVTGVVGQYNGLTQLVHPRIRLVRASQRLPPPRTIAFTRAGAERWEGSFVRVRGRVLDREARGAGEAMRLAAGPGPDDVLEVYVPRRHDPPVPLDGYEPGQQVEVVGVLGQYDTGAALDRQYQLYPRIPGDITSLSVTPRTYRRVALATVFALCLVLTWVAALRLQVRRRTGQLRASEARFRAIYEGALDGILVQAPDGRVADANPAATRLLGRTLDELRGARVGDLLAELPVEGAEEGGTREREGRVRRPDGGTVEVAITRALVRFEREPRVLTLLHDITLRKHAEARLREAKDEAERANRAKSDFLSRMSHELRTPLNAILGFAQLLTLGERSPGDRESADQILRGGRHLLDLINEVLDIARIESGRLALSPEPVPLRELLDSALGLVRPAADARGIALGGELCDDGCHVLADRRRLTQVVLNLLSNAIKYDRPGGRVTLRARPGAPGRVRVEVADTGPGISADDIARLFVPFERLGAERRGVEGEGIGLALSHGLMRAMGGELGVDSAPGEGSTFWIDLAAWDCASDDAAAGAGAGAADDRDGDGTHGGTARRVLYIEDNPSNYKLVERVLAARPRLRLATAGTGAGGLAAAQQAPPHLVLLDLHLPDMHGSEVYERLRASPATAHVPVVVISADATAAHIDALLARGVAAYLTKPLDVGEFLRVLDTVAWDGEAG